MKVILATAAVFGALFFSQGEAQAQSSQAMMCWGLSVERDDLLEEAESHEENDRPGIAQGRRCTAQLVLREMCSLNCHNDDYCGGEEPFDTNMSGSELNDYYDGCIGDGHLD